MKNLIAAAGVLRRTPSAIAIAAATMAAGTAAHASLTTFQSYNGNVAVSTDGWGGSDGNGIISASAPNGSSVLAAYLYTANDFGGGATTPTTVTLNGSSVGGYVNLGSNNVPLTAFRSDVTSIVKPIIDAGGGPVYDFNIAEGANNGNIDGHALVVVYENAALPDASVGILDGFSDTQGDSTSINFADPLDLSGGFFAEMALGISFSCCNQNSPIDVNGNRITNNAGNNDDGENVANGSLITVGSFDDPFSPLLPSYNEDTERYDLAALGVLNDGDTSILIESFNPTNDDNIFLAAFYVKGEAGFNEPPPSDPPTDVIPLPAPMLLLLSGLAGLGAVRRRKKS